MYQLPKASFIAVTTTLLKHLTQADLRAFSEVSFEVKKDQISIVGTDIVHHANAIVGTGVFTYNVNDIKRLIKILRPISEQPITITFGYSCITIQQIMI